MGKIEEQSLHQQQQSHHEAWNRDSSGLLCEGCSMFLTGIAQDFSLQCVIVLLLSLSMLVSGIFWILPYRAMKCGFDAQQAIKLSAPVQAYFFFEKPVLQLVPRTARLEHDINAEIGVPNAKVAILSMHQLGASNQTTVVFGALPVPINARISPVS